MRTGRASAALLDRINVDYYGAQTPLKQLATVGPRGAAADRPAVRQDSIKTIERAILESDVGLTPNNDGQIIRLQIPELTEERRKELVKVVRSLAEEGRVAIRNIRRDVMHDLRELQGRRRGRLRRRAPRRGGAPEAHRREDQGARRGPQGQGRRDPRGVRAPRTSPSSRMATDAGPGSGACPSTRATARAPTPSRPASATPSTSACAS